MSTGTTIYDIAKEAGVSISTVSRVLSGTAPVSEASRRKVEEAITRRGYHPSAIARGMTSKTTNTLGIVLPKLVNPNYAMIFTGASDEAQRTGRSISLFPVQSLETAEYDGAAMLAERSLDGVIICVEHIEPQYKDRFISSLKDLRGVMPVALIGYAPEGIPYPAVCYDLIGIMKKLVEYLTSLGHTRIAFIGGSEDDRYEGSRDVGFRSAMEEAGLPMPPEYRKYCLGTSLEGERTLLDMLSSLPRRHWPTAVIALNDLVALGCMSAARKMGLKLPRDLSIVGCDNLVGSAYFSPALTTVDTHQQMMGQRAVKLLLSSEMRRECSDWEFIERESCCKARV